MSLLSPNRKRMVPPRLSKSEFFAFVSFQFFRSLVYAGSGRPSRDRFSHGVVCILAITRLVVMSFEYFNIRSKLTIVWAFDEPARASTDSSILQLSPQIKDITFCNYTDCYTLYVFFCVRQGSGANRRRPDVACLTGQDTLGCAESRAYSSVVRVVSLAFIKECRMN